MKIMKKVTIFLLFLITLSTFSCRAQELSIPAISKEITWVHTPKAWSFEDNALTITGGKGSRLFVDPTGSSRADSAPMALFEPDENFLFSAKVKVDFEAVFDAGVLVIYADSTQWAKFCFEYAPDHSNMIVTVCNNQFSDDNNHIVTESDEMYLRIAGMGGGAYAFHYSTDGKFWHMARYFYLDPTYDYKIGFLSQSPRGEEFTTVFSDIRYSAEKLGDVRSGE
jgi:regulation of enolase protein 1 (concanavalin A-like superfamily)